MKHNRKMLLPLPVTNLLIGLIISWVITLLVCTVGATMIATGNMGEENGGYCALLALLLGSFCGALVPKIKSEGKGSLWCIVQGAAYFLSLLLAGTILFDGKLQGIGVTALVSLGGAAVTALLGKRGKKATIPLRRKYKIGHLV